MGGSQITQRKPHMVTSAAHNQRRNNIKSCSLIMPCSTHFGMHTFHNLISEDDTSPVALLFFSPTWISCFCSKYVTLLYKWTPKKKKTVGFPFYIVLRTHSVWCTHLLPYFLTLTNLLTGLLHWSFIFFNTNSWVKTTCFYFVGLSCNGVTLSYQNDRIS